MDQQPTGVPTLRELMRLRKMSKAIVAAALGVTGYELATIMRSGRALPTEQAVLAKVLKVSESDLLLVLEETHRRSEKSVGGVRAGGFGGGYVPPKQSGDQQHEQRVEQSPSGDQEEVAAEKTQPEGNA